MIKNLRNLCLCMALGLLTSACSSVPNDHFYTLIDPAQQATTPGAAQDGCAGVSINAVTLPETVDRSELVLRNDSHSVKVMDGQRWAESLKSAIPRAIAQDLSARLQCANISVQADNASRDAAYLVWVDVTRFDSELGKAAILEASWGIRAAAGSASRKGTSHLRVAVKGEGYDHLVAAHAHALALLSDDIAVQIRELEKAGN